MRTNRTVDTLTIVFGQGLNTLINLVFVPYLSRSLSIHENGTYGQTIIVIDFVSMFFQFGLYKVLYKFYADAEVENSSAFKNNLLASLGLGVVGILSILLFAPAISGAFDNPTLEPLLLIYAFVIPFSFLSQTFTSSLVYYKRIKASVLISVLSNLFKILGVLFAIQVLHDLSSVFYALIIAAGFQCIASYWALPPELKSGKFDWGLIKEQFSLGLPLGITAVLGIGFRYTDGAMVSMMLSTDEFAIYRNGAFELPFIGVLYAAIGTVLLPDMAQYYSAGKFKEIILLKRRSISITFSLILPIVIFILFFSQPIIVSYLSDKYAASGNVFMIYSLVLLIRITDYQGLFIVAGKNNVQLYIYIVVFGVNLLLNYVFIQFFGLLGPAISAVLSTFLLAYLLLHYSLGYINSSIRDLFDFKSISQIAVISAVFALLLWLIWNSISNLNSFWVFPIFGFYLICCLHFFLKFHLVDKNIFINVLSRNRFSKPFCAYVDNFY